MTMERPGLEVFRTHVERFKGLSIQEELAVIDYALSLEQKLERLTKRLEEIAKRETDQLIAERIGVDEEFASTADRLKLAQELLKELR